MKKLTIPHNRIKSKSAVTALSYGIIAALITVVISGSVYAVGNDLQSNFSGIGEFLSFSTTQSSLAQDGLSTPNPALSLEQQQEVAEAASEVATGTASLSCLEAMNGADARTMNNIGATCTPIGFPTNLAPPSEPVRGIAYTGPNGQQWIADIEQDGTVYMMGRGGNGPNSVLYFGDGYIASTSGYNCASPSNETGYGSPTSEDNLSQYQVNMVSCKAPYTGYGNVGALGGTSVTDDFGNSLSTSTFTPTNASAQNPLGVDSAFSF